MSNKIEVFVRIKVQMMERDGAVGILFFLALRELAKLDTCRVIRPGSQSCSCFSRLHFPTTISGRTLI